MKEKIHPKWYPDAKVSCACGASWAVGATVPEIRTDICSTCHPFYTGEMRIVDTEGQVERFMKRLQARDGIRQEGEDRAAALTSSDTTLEQLELSTRVMKTLKGAGLADAGALMEKLAESDDVLLDIQGFGRKALADVKKALRTRGFVLPEDESAE